MNQYKPEGMLINHAKNAEYTSSTEGLRQALEKQIILEAPVAMSDHNLNLIINFCHGIKGVIPKNEVVFSDKEPVKDIAVLTRVGKVVCFKVVELNKDSEGNVIAILSRRAAQRECMEKYISHLMPGDIIPAKVTHLESFGAFLDIGCGLL